MLAHHLIAYKTAGSIGGDITVDEMFYLTEVSNEELPIIMVQWHPELMHRDPIKGTLDQDRIFMYFASLLK